jgi:hypothetical protein
MNCSIAEHFSALNDLRLERKKLHQLMDIIVLSICATLSGAQGWEDIAEFGHNKLDWLRQFVPFKHGVPSHDRKNNKTPLHMVSAWWNAPAIMSAIRHICLNLFQKEPSKISTKKKMNRAAWNDSYRAKLLFAV